MKSAVDFAHGGLDQMKQKLAANAVFAPMDGLVVYANVGRPEDGKKVEVGMTPYEGQPLMYLPDITSMQVETEVNEMDVEKVESASRSRSRSTRCRTWSSRARCATIGSLAQHKVSKVSGKRTGVKVFDVTVDVDRRGSAPASRAVRQASILIDELKGVTYVPVEAIFNEDGKTVAYVKQGSPRPHASSSIAAPATTSTSSSARACSPATRSTSDSPAEGAAC